MGMGKLTYEECRQRRLEENKKRLEDLNLPRLAQSLRALSPNPSPMKKANSKSRNMEKQSVAVRRSARVASNPAPVYVEAKIGRMMTSRSSNMYGVPRSSSRYPSVPVYVSEKARACAIEKAEKLVENLDPSYPTVVRPMLPSHVSGCFWLGLPLEFCRQNMPKTDQPITLVDEEGGEYQTNWLQRKTGLSGGWRGFALSHGLVDGDAVVFQVIKHGVLKVYIINTNELEDCES